MSYPGYPGYPNQPGRQPEQSGLPPMYQTTPLAYPVYPASAAPQPYPNYGAPPSQYPQSSPYPTQPSYPTSSYPGTGGYPNNASPYPSNTSPYPSNASPYPSNPAPYPRNPAPYPSNPAPYPSNPAPYPGNPSYPSNPTSYPGNYAPNQPYPSQHPGPTAASHAPGAHSFSPTSNPTLRAANPFNPRADAEILRKAMKGFGTDEKALISVITKRTNQQRQQISTEFKTLYGKDLISDIKSETGGNLEDTLVSLLTPLPEFLAKEVHHALSGIGTVEETLVEILCSATNYEIKCICSAYQHLYGSSLEQELAGDTSGNFRRLLVSLCQGNRNEMYQVDMGAAVSDAQALLRAGELKLGTDESTFNAILCSRSYPQLAQTFVEYQRLTGNDFETAVKNEFSGDVEAGLRAIIKCVRNKADFFADELHKSMAGVGTKDRALIRILCWRCEVDLGDIMAAYQAKFGTSLSEAIASETSGDYKKALLSLLS